jgi:hypothetical protein
LRETSQWNFHVNLIGLGRADMGTVIGDRQDLLSSVEASSISIETENSMDLSNESWD